VPAHNHLLFTYVTSTPAAASDIGYQGQVAGGGPYTIILRQPSGSIATVDLYSSGTSGQTTAAAEAAHTHPMVAGIYESTVATNVKVIVNSTDRTVALGGPAGGFTTDQTELALTVAWLSVGAWNEIDLQASGLGRITGHLRVQGYVQAV
jgi:hypothetical protein